MILAAAFSAGFADFARDSCCVLFPRSLWLLFEASFSLQPSFQTQNSVRWGNQLSIRLIASFTIGMDSFDGPICEICGGLSCFIPSPTSHFGYIEQCISLSIPNSPMTIPSSITKKSEPNTQSTSRFSHSTSTPRIPSKPTSPPIKAENHNEATEFQTASRKRIPRPPPLYNDDVEEEIGIYRHRARGQWWYRGEAKFAQMRKREKIKWSHIGRIMETAFGEEYEDRDRCVHCQERGFECWGYSKRGRAMVKTGRGRQTTTSCTRCLSCNNKCSNSLGRYTVGN